MLGVRPQSQRRIESYRRQRVPRSQDSRLAFTRKLANSSSRLQRQYGAPEKVCGCPPEDFAGPIHRPLGSLFEVRQDSEGERVWRPPSICCATVSSIHSRKGRGRR